MKTMKRTLCLLLVIASLASLLVFPASAASASPIIDAGDYYYIASALDTNKVLDVKNGSTSNGANIQLYKKNGTNAQLFRFVKSSTDGYYYIINKGSGKAIDVQNGSTASGTNVQQYKRNNTQAQRWKLQYADDGNITIQAQCGKYLDVKNAETKNGTNIWIYTGNGTKAQKFVLIPYVSRTYKTVELEFHDLQSWMEAVSTAQRSITVGGSLVTNYSGNTYYNGKIIIGAEVLEYKQLTVKLPAQGPGNPYTKKTIKFPSVIRYKLHTHNSKVNWWFDFTQLRSWQSCTCGYHDEWTWEFPWPDTGDTQTTSKTIDAIRPVWKAQYNVR